MMDSRSDAPTAGEPAAPGRAAGPVPAGEAARLHDAFARLREALSAEIVGQAALIERLLIALLADGHLLVEGAPGLAKTSAIRALAARLEADFARVQFTPDLLPADLTGTEVWRPQEGRFEFQPGPIFHPVLLADEINRAPAKVQSALLEAMQEKQVTIGGTTYRLEEPFLVLATQNPIEQEGTYPLPEAQLDRFMLELRVGYPSRAEEEAIVEQTTGANRAAIEPVLDAGQLLAIQALVRRIPVSRGLIRSAVTLARLTRPADGDAPGFIREYVDWGAGPRASQYLVLGAKARAALAGRPMADLDDVRAVAPAVLRHRVVTNFAAEAADRTSEDIVRELVAGKGWLAG